MAGNRPEDSTPQFAEMAAPGTVFEGLWREPVSTARILESANTYAAKLLEIQKQYAASANLPLVAKAVEELESRLAAARAGGSSCIVSMGWGSGLLAKTAWLDTDSDVYRQTLRQVALYSRALQSGLPFPKTRRVLFLGNQPATLQGRGLVGVG